MLWLLRHADAAPGHPDAPRPLTERGLDDARAAGLAIAALQIKLDTCLSSPKRRAEQTAELACEPIGLKVHFSDDLAAGEFDALAVAAGHGETMLVGHNPSISDALHDLTGVRAQLKKGGLAGIRDGELTIMLGPRELHAIAAGSSSRRSNGRRQNSGR